MDLYELVADLDEYLESEVVADYGPNGLQVEGRREVLRVTTGVSACRELFERAVEEGSDAVVVHHGILWSGGEPPRLVGSFRDRVRLLLENDISLLAYHLPLDRHLEVGNAAQLARRLGLAEVEPFGLHRGVTSGVCGVFAEPIPIGELVAAVGAACEREPQLFRGAAEEVVSLGIITGGAKREYAQAVDAGLDAYITGEAAEWVMHQAAEDGVHYIAAGHYATERFGVQALGRWLERSRNLDVRFVDLPNPV